MRWVPGRLAAPRAMCTQGLLRQPPVPRPTGSCCSWHSPRWLCVLSNEHDPIYGEPAPGQRSAECRFSVLAIHQLRPLQACGPFLRLTRVSGQASARPEVVATGPPCLWLLMQPAGPLEHNQTTSSCWPVRSPPPHRSALNFTLEDARESSVPSARRPECGAHMWGSWAVYRHPSAVSVCHLSSPGPFSTSAHPPCRRELEGKRPLRGLWLE